MNEIVSLTVKKGNQQEENIIKFIDQTEKQSNDEKQPSIFSSRFLSFSEFEIVQNKLIEQGKSPLGELIGGGGEADIYRSKDQKVVYRVGQAEDRQKYQDFIQEFEIVKSMKNSVSIINYQDALFIDSIRVAIIQMEECQCSLFQELRNYNLSNEKLSFTHFLNIMFDLFDGLIELRSHNIINSDIKPGNILKTKDNIYIISDFGISLKIRDQQTRVDKEEIKGHTPGYFPESFEHAYQIDLYAVGVTLLRVLNETQTHSLSVNFQQQIIKYLKRQEDKLIECKDIPSIFLSQLQEYEFLPFLMKYLNKINSIIHQDLYDIKKNIFQSTHALLSYLEMKEMTISYILKSEENLTNLMNKQRMQMNQELTSRDSLFDELLRDIYMSGRICMQLGKFDSARGIFAKILDQLVKNVNLEQKKSIWMKAKCMRKLGRCDEQEIKIEESLKLQTETLDFLLKSPLSTDLITIQQYWIVSQCYSQLNNEEEAKQYFEIFRSYIDRQQHKSAKEEMSLLYSIGCKYLDQNKLELASKYLNELKDLYSFNSTSSVNLKEANCYLQLGKLNLKIQEQQTSLFLSNQSIVPQTKNKELDFLLRRSTNQIKEALVYFQKSLQIKERVYHQNHICFSELYIYIGECYTYLQEKINAINFLERAFKIRFKAFKLEHPLTEESVFKWLLIYYRMDDTQNSQVENLMGYLQNSKNLKSYKKTLEMISDQNLENTQYQEQIENIVNLILKGAKNYYGLNTLLHQLHKNDSINTLKLFRQTEYINCNEDIAQSAKENQVEWFLQTIRNQIDRKLNDKQKYKKKVDDENIEQKIQHQEELTSEDIQNILLQSIGRKGLKSLKVLDCKYSHIIFEGDLGIKIIESQNGEIKFLNKIYLTYGKCPQQPSEIQSILISENLELQNHNLSFLQDKQSQQYYFSITSKGFFHGVKVFLMESDSEFIEKYVIQKRIIYQIVKIIFQLVQDNHTISEVNLNNFFINPKTFEVIFFVNQYALGIQSLMKRDYTQQIKFYLLRAVFCLLYIDNFRQLEEQYSVLFSNKIFEDDNSKEYRRALQKLAQIKRDSYAFNIIEKLLNMLDLKDINLDEVYKQLFPQIEFNQEIETVNRQNNQMGFLKIDNKANLKSINFSSLKIIEIIVGFQNSVQYESLQDFIETIFNKTSEMINLDSFSMYFSQIANICLSSELLTLFSNKLKICSNLKSLTLRIEDFYLTIETVLYFLDSLTTLQKLERLSLSLGFLNIKEIQMKLSEVIFLLPVLNHFKIDQINLQLFQQLQPVIANTVNLQSLDFQFIDDKGCQEFQFDTFPQSIQKLRLSIKEITHLDFIALLSKGIGQCSNLLDLKLEFDLGLNKINYEDLLNPSNFQLFQLTRLEINVTIFDINHFDSFILIGEIVSEQRYLQQLILSFENTYSMISKPNNLPLKKLFKGISNCTLLNTLSLSLGDYLIISETDSLLFADSLVSIEQLQHFQFRISYNNPNVIQNIFNRSNKFKKLTHLSCSFENCRISPQEANLILSMLQMCTHLKTLRLNMSYNPLDTFGLQLLGQAISNCNSLKNLTLNMEKCELKPQKLFNICLPIAMLRVLQKLELNIPNNQIDNIDINVLEQILPQCVNLNILKLDLTITQKIQITQMYNLFKGISLMKSLYSFSHTWDKFLPNFVRRKLFKSLTLVKC